MNEILKLKLSYRLWQKKNGPDLDNKILGLDLGEKILGPDQGEKIPSALDISRKKVR